MKILVVFTGGTIACSVSEEGLRCIEDGGEKILLRTFKQLYPDKNIDFDTISPVLTLSENMNKSDWFSILKELKTIDQNLYDGIIVAHGTDTLPYTAAALDMGGVWTVPIIMVSSNLPISNPDANGVDNLLAAIELIKFMNLNNKAGVKITYLNRDKKMMVYDPQNLTEADSVLDDFSHIKTASGTMSKKNNSFIYMPLKNWRDTTNNTWASGPGKKVLTILPIPGLDYNWFNVDADTPPDIVLHGSYHSGTVNGSEDDGNLLEFIEKCDRLGVVFRRWKATESTEDYQSSVNIMKHGHTVVFGVSFEYAYVQCVLEK